MSKIFFCSQNILINDYVLITVIKYQKHGDKAFIKSSLDHSFMSKLSFYVSYIKVTKVLGG